MFIARAWRSFRTPLGVPCFRSFNRRTWTIYSDVINESAAKHKDALKNTNLEERVGNEEDY